MHHLVGGDVRAHQSLHTGVRARCRHGVERAPAKTTGEEGKRGSERERDVGLTGLFDV